MCIEDKAKHFVEDQTNFSGVTVELFISKFNWEVYLCILEREQPLTSPMPYQKHKNDFRISSIQ